MILRPRNDFSPTNVITAKRKSSLTFAYRPSTRMKSFYLIVETSSDIKRLFYEKQSVSYIVTAAYCGLG